MANPTMTLISSQTLGGTTASVTFSSIPSTYNDLKLVCSVRGDAAIISSYMLIKLNGDTASNYSDTRLYGNSSTAASSRESGTDANTVVYGFEQASATATTFALSEIYIPNYNSTGSKPFFVNGVSEMNNTTASNSLIAAEAFLYRGASGISSIALTPSSGNFVQYSNFYLYGIKNS